MPEDPWKKWVNSNPLRSWRRKAGMPVLQAAGVLGVTITAVQTWERGTNHPTAANMAKIAVLVSDAKLPAKWDRWLAKCPKVTV